MKLSLIALTSILAAGVVASPTANDASLTKRTNYCDYYTKKYGECKKKEDWYKKKWDDCAKGEKPYENGEPLRLPPPPLLSPFFSISTNSRLQPMRPAKPTKTNTTMTTSPARSPRATGSARTRRRSTTTRRRSATRRSSTGTTSMTIARTTRRTIGIARGIAISIMRRRRSTARSSRCC